MTKKMFTLFIAGFLMFAAPRTASARTILGDYLKEKNIEIEVTGSLDFYNKYVWRGFELDSDPVIQPGFVVSSHGVEAGFWSNFDVAQSDGDGTNSDEVDGWIGYNFDLGFIDESLDIVSLSVGHTWYSFPGADGYSKEYYVTVAMDTFLAPYFTWFHDYVDESQGGADGNYYHIGGSHSFTLNEEYGITFDVAQEVGFNDEAFINGNGGFSLTTLGLTIPVTESFSMTPTVAYSSPFGDLEDDGDGAQEDQFYTGVAMAYVF